MKKILLIALCAVSSFGFANCMDQNNQKNTHELSEQAQQNRANAINHLIAIEGNEYAGFIALIQNDKCMDSLIRILANVNGVFNQFDGVGKRDVDSYYVLKMKCCPGNVLSDSSNRTQIFINVLRSVSDNPVIFCGIFQKIIVSIFESKFGLCREISDQLGRVEANLMFEVNCENMANFVNSYWGNKAVTEYKIDTLFGDQKAEKWANLNFSEQKSGIDTALIDYLKKGGLRHLEKFLSTEASVNQVEFQILKKFFTRFASSKKVAFYLYDFISNAPYADENFVNYVGRNIELLEIIAASWACHANKWLYLKNLLDIDPFDFQALGDNTAALRGRLDNKDKLIATRPDVRLIFANAAAKESFDFDGGFIQKEEFLDEIDVDSSNEDSSTFLSDQDAINKINSAIQNTLNMDEQFKQLVKQKEDTENAIFMKCLKSEGVDALLNFLETRYAYSLAISLERKSIFDRFIRVLFENQEAFSSFFDGSLPSSDDLLNQLQYNDQDAPSVTYINPDMRDGKMNWQIRAQHHNNFRNLFTQNDYERVLTRFLSMNKYEEFGGMGDASEIFDDFLAAAISKHSVILEGCADAMLNANYYDIIQSSAIKNKELYLKLSLGILIKKKIDAAKKIFEELKKTRK